MLTSCGDDLGLIIYFCFFCLFCNDNNNYCLLFRYMRNIGEKVKGMNFTFVDLSSSQKEELLEIAIKSHPRTQMIWIETPTNPTLKVIDIKAICKIAHKYNLIVVIDNTFATPFNQTPLDLGADIVVHSITKYLNGHSDIVMGIALTNNDDLRDRLAFVQNSLGAVPSPFDCYMVIRGMKTLELRMKKHGENAHKLAQFLEKHPKVTFSRVAKEMCNNNNIKL